MYYLKIREIEKDKKQIVEKLSELDDEISAINIDFNHNSSLLEEENKKLAPLRDKKMESAASLQKLNTTKQHKERRSIKKNWQKFKPHIKSD